MNTLYDAAKALLHRQVWASKMFGVPPIGAALVYAYYSEEGEGWRSAPEIAKLAHVSEDTARRTLRKLARISRVEERVAGRTIQYRLVPDIAQKAMDLLLSVPD